MAGLFKNALKRIPFIEAFRAFLEQWGIWGWITTIGGVMIAAIVSGWAWLTSTLPPWAVFLVFLATLVLLLWVFNFGVDTYRKFSAERLDHEKIADGLIALSSEMMRAFNDYVRDRERFTAAPVAPVSGDTKMLYEEWVRKRQENENLVRNMAEKFGPRISANIILLRRLDIRIPFHLSYISEDTVIGLASFLGAAGYLIKTGNLAAAQNLDQQASWDLSKIIR